MAEYKVSDSDLLIKTLESVAKSETPTDGVRKFKFDNGRVVSVYDTGTVLFQGKDSEECNIKEEVIKKIEAINIITTPISQCIKK
jgi:ribonuclease HIII